MGAGKAGAADLVVGFNRLTFVSSQLPTLKYAAYPKLKMRKVELRDRIQSCIISFASANYQLAFSCFEGFRLLLLIMGTSSKLCSSCTALFTIDESVNDDGIRHLRDYISFNSFLLGVSQQCFVCCTIWRSLSAESRDSLSTWIWNWRVMGPIRLKNCSDLLCVEFHTSTPKFIRFWLTEVNGTMSANSLFKGRRYNFI